MLQLFLILLCACTSLTLTGSETYCRGFASCIHAQSIESTSNLYASGSYSAYNATNVTSSGSFCYGDSSCRKITHFQSEYITCNGYRSCFGSTITRPENSTYTLSNIVLNGDESGAFTTLNIYDDTKIYAKGRLSMYESKVNIFVSSSLYAQGFASLSGANLYCEKGQTCTIYCHAYGCYNISSINGNGTFDTRCAHNKVSNVLCNETQDDATDDISIGALNNLSSDIMDIGFEDVDALSLCSNLNSSMLGINCGDYEECQNDALNYTYKAICCSGAYGCEYSSATLTVTNLSNINVSDNIIGIYCHGSGSCQDIISGNKKFMIQESADYGCNISQSYNIFCDGYFACLYLDLSGTGNIFCRAFESCETVKIDAIKNAFIFGSTGMDNGTISNVSGSVYCLALQSCSGTRFSQIGREYLWTSKKGIKWGNYW